ncbi:MFS transporter [Streptomyces sp. NPDC085866]|uniref:MFS transporter n=1 Tax=unclassified Streptomyces TaxID=2593676 RepID=UPI0037B4E917
MSTAETGTEKVGFMAFFRNPDVRAPVVWGALGRMPLYLVSLGMVLYVADRTGSYGTAGLVLGAYTVGGALFGPLIAREVDRRGQRVVLPVTGLLFPALLAGLVHSVPDHVGAALVWALLSGGAIPPVSGAIRALWGTWLTDEAERRAAYAMEAVLAEVFVICGPLLLSVLIACLSAGTAILIGAVIACVGAVGLAWTKAGKELGVTGAVKRDWAGPLRSRPLILLFVVLAGCTFALGMFNLAVPASAEKYGAPGAAGVLYACSGVGSALGGVWYGRRKFTARVEHQLTWGLIAFAAGLGLAALAWDNWSLGVALAIGGVSIAPLTAMEFMLVSRLAPQQTLAEAFTWVMTANAIGMAAGSQVAGLMADPFGPSAVFATAACAALAVTVLGHLVRDRLADPAGPSDAEQEAGTGVAAEEPAHEA